MQQWAHDGRRVLGIRIIKSLLMSFWYMENDLEAKRVDSMRVLINVSNAAVRADDFATPRDETDRSIMEREMNATGNR